MALARSDLVDEPATQADADDDDTPGPIVLTRPAVGFFIAGSNDKNMLDAASSNSFEKAGPARGA